MATAKVTSKGQVTIPKIIREQLGLRPGDEIEFREEDGIIQVCKRVRVSPFEKYYGYLKDLKGRSSDELVAEMRDPDFGV